MNKFLIYGVFAFTLVASALAAVGPVSQYGQLQSGKNSSGQGRIYGSCPTYSTSGNEVQIQGMSLFWAIASDVGSPFWTADYVKGLVEKQGIQLIRAPMGVDEDWGAGNYFTNKSFYQGIMNQVVQAAIDNDIYVIIDYHSHKAHENVSNAKTFFEEMAKKWGNYDNVIFEIYNEPLETSWSTIKSYADEVIPVIRKYSDNLIVVGNRAWDQYPNEAVSNPINDKNIAYTFHFYAGSHSTTREGANAVTAMNSGLSVFVSEWGTVNADGNGGVSSAASTWLSWMNSHKLSGANWSVSNKAEGASYFNGSAWNYSESGQWVNTNIFSRLPKSYTACSGSIPVQSSSSTVSSSSSMASGYTDYIDDFEDGDSLAFTGGIWYAYTDKDDGGTSTLTNATNKDNVGNSGYDVVFTSDNGSKNMAGLKGVQLSQGTNKYEPYVALGLKLNADESAYDLSSCNTISYKYKGASHNFKAEDLNVKDYAYHQISKMGSSSWIEATISWTLLTQPSWTSDEVTLSKTRVNKFTWEIKGNTQGTQPDYNYLYIDDVRCNGLAIKPVVPSVSSSSSAKPLSSSSAKSSSSSAITSSSSSLSSSSVKYSSSSSEKLSSSSSEPSSYQISGSLNQTVQPGSSFETITITGITSYNRESWTLSFLTVEQSGSTLKISGPVQSWAPVGNYTEKFTINGELVEVSVNVTNETISSSSSSVESSGASEESSSSSAEYTSSSSSENSTGIVNSFKNPLSISMNGKTLAVHGAKWINVNIFDLQGRPVQTFNNIANSVSLAHIKSGSYIVRITSGSNQLIRLVKLK